MTLDRRTMLAAGPAALTSGVALPATTMAGARAEVPAIGHVAYRPKRATGDETAALEAALAEAEAAGLPLVLPPRAIAVTTVRLPDRAALIGRRGHTRLVALGDGPVLVARDAEAIEIADLTIDGQGKAARAEGAGHVQLEGIANAIVDGVTATASAGHGVVLVRCGGRISDCVVSHAERTAIFVLDSSSVTIEGCSVHDIADNGIQVWRSEPGSDGSRVIANTIARVRAASGGTGQYGNGVNVFRAGDVLVANNRITDCAYTAVRGNAASGIQILANSCARLGEVALYAEFGFEGALIAQNVIDGAATGISVTNFNDGGRLAVVQGNLIRNLHRREHEPEDKRGEGIGVEADTAVTGNVIEGAPTAGIAIGWGRYMRNVTATGNVIRDAGIGIAVSNDAAAGGVVISGNMIAGARRGAIRTMRFREPVGPDLAREGAGGLIMVTGNAVADA